MSERKKVPEERKEKKSAAVYTKSQLTASRRYQEQRDLLEALLEEEKSYSFEEIEQIMEQYRKGTVK